MPNNCPDPAALEALLSGRIDENRLTAIESHVETCRSCQERLESLAGMAVVLPKTDIPSKLREAAGSHRLSNVIQKLRGRAPASRTAIGVPETDVLPIDESPTARDRLSRQPRQIAEYDIQAVLGRGGIGVVYRATDRALARDVAIKVLRADLADNDSLRERFLREARAAAALRHDNVVTIYGVGQHAEQPYLVMEYVPGGSLADRLLRKGKLSGPEVIRLGIEVASSLAAAHARGIVHRDVKPGNVLWDAESARYKLTDFGLAKALDDVSLTRTGTLVGTPEYLSPEQAEGGTVDARSDLFSLGALLYAACTGESPFHADSTIGVLHRVRTLLPPGVRQMRPDCPAELAKVIDRLLIKNLNQRYQSAGAVVEELRRIEARLGASSAHHAPPGRARSARAWPARLVAAAALVFVTAAVIGGWLATRDVDSGAESDNGVVAPQGAFVVQGASRRFDALSDAVAAAPAGGVIEIHGSNRFPMKPIRIEGRPLVIRAVAGGRPILVPDGKESQSEPAITTDSDLTLEGLQIEWAAEAGSEDDFVPRACAVQASGGWLQVNHCDLTVSRFAVCVRVAGARCELRNSRLSARRGPCVAWRPAAAAPLRLENCVLSGDCCISIVDRRGPSALPAALEIARNTWQASKGLTVVVSPGKMGPSKIRLTGNRFAVDHMLVMFWPHRGPKSVQAPNIPFVRRALREMFVWQEQENLYGAKSRFVSWQSTRQPVTAVTDSPRDIDAWEAFWNVPGTGSRQGAASDLRGKVGADESNVGPAG
jgi:tRNA A-37 threonylcarbamoyl transferase component Bud32/anti-sigma factor RsiW